MIKRCLCGFFFFYNVMVGFNCLFRSDMPGLSATFFLLAAAFLVGLWMIDINYKAAMKQETERPVQHIPDNSIVVSVMATGPDPEVDEILRISIIDLSGNVIFDHLIKPSYYKAWRSPVTPEMVRNEKIIAMYRDELNQIFSKTDCVIGYNITKDLAFLRNSRITCSKPVIDVKRDFGDYRRLKDPRFAFDRKYTLESAAAYSGYEWDNQEEHYSIDNDIATLQCLRKLYNAGFYGTPARQI